MEPLCSIDEMPGMFTLRTMICFADEHTQQTRSHLCSGPVQRPQLPVSMAGRFADLMRHRDGITNSGLVYSGANQFGIDARPVRERPLYRYADRHGIVTWAGMDCRYGMISVH